MYIHVYSNDKKYDFGCGLDEIHVLTVDSFSLINASKASYGRPEGGQVF